MSGTGLYLVPLYRLYGGTGLRRRGSIFQIILAGRHRRHEMAGAFPTIYRREESLHVQEIFVMYCDHPARSQRGKGDRGVTHPRNARHINCNIFVNISMILMIACDGSSMSRRGIEAVDVRFGIESS